MNTTHNSIDSNVIDVSVYNPSPNLDCNQNGSFLASMQSIPSPPTNAPFANALHPSSNTIANHNDFLHSFNLSNTPTNPSLNLMDFFMYPQHLRQVPHQMIQYQTHLNV